MKTATIRELRHDTTAVLSWVTRGESVEVLRRGAPVALLTPRKRKARVVRPDFLARIQTAYGKHALSPTATDLISDARGEA